MIQLTRLSQRPMILNSDLIEHIESTPDTVVALTTGQTFVVRESPEEVVERIVAFRRSISCAGCRWGIERNPSPVGKEPTPERLNSHGHSDQ